MATEQEIELQKNVVFFLDSATDDAKAIVSMLTIMANQANAHEEKLERIAKAIEQMAKHFEQVTVGGQVMLTEAVLR